MDADKKIIAGIGLLVLVGGAAYVAKTNDDKVGKTTTASAELPNVKGPEDPDKLEVTSEKGKVVLVKTGDKWALEEPVKFPAHAANIKSLVDNLKELKANEVIASNVGADQLKNYELDGKKVKLIQKVNTARKEAIARGMTLEEAMKTFTDETV
jgi:hypothetical protein